MKNGQHAFFRYFNKWHVQEPPDHSGLPHQAAFPGALCTESIAMFTLLFKLTPQVQKVSSDAGQGILAYSLLLKLVFW